MDSLSSAPFVRILPAFCIGISVSFLGNVDQSIIHSIFLIGILVSLFINSQKKQTYSARYFSGLAFQLVFFSLGFLLNEIKDNREHSSDISNFQDQNNFIITINDQPTERNGNYRSTANFEAVVEQGKPEPIRGKCYIYFKNDSNAINLFPGDRLLISGNIAAIKPPLNPGQFDFSKYASLKRIYHQVYINEGGWRKIDSSRFSIKKISTILRNEFLNTYKKAGLTGQELAVLSALVLGYDEEIDRKTMQAFSASGTLHVLSVSGMHVGIIFTALSALLLFLERRKTGRIVRLIVLLLSLWFYALLTGLSPSVIRSSMMFSFILIGRSLNRSSNIYNSLALSAFCIFIFFDPLMLFDVGLQLSFIAVAGIAFLYPKVYKWFYFENSFCDKTWSLIAVSIAAQAATFAISIYYFHQFPNYFIPANLIIIPLSTVGIFSGIFLLFIGPIQFLVTKVGWLIQKLVLLLNESAIFIEKMPGSQWKCISINLFDMVLIYSILISLVLYFGKKSVQYLYALQIFLIILISSFIYSQFEIRKSKELIVYSNTSSLCCHARFGRNNYLLYHLEDSAKANRNFLSYCESSGIPTSHRKLICMDSLKNRFLDSHVFIWKNNILLGNYHVFDYSTKSNNISSIKSDLLYARDNYHLIGILNKIEANEIVVGGKQKLKGSIDSVSTAVKISYLENGFKLIKL